MVGGTIEQVTEEKPGVLRVTVAERRDICRVRVEAADTARKMRPGDNLWWQGRTAYWTPAGARSTAQSTAEVDDYLRTLADEDAEFLAERGLAPDLEPIRLCGGAMNASEERTMYEKAMRGEL